MGMNVLELVQEFCKRTGIGSPLTGVANTSPQIQQIVALLNEELEEITIRKNWQQMVVEKVFQTIAAEDQGDLPTLIGADFEAFMSETLWDRDERLPIYGPQNASDWQSQQALDNASPRYTFRLRGDHLLIYPAPPAGKNIALEYRTRFGVLDGDGSTRKERIDSDADTFLFSDAQMLAGLRWRWKREKGLTYAEDKERYNTIVSAKMERNYNKGRLKMTSGQEDPRPQIYVPQGYWTVS